MSKKNIKIMIAILGIVGSIASIFGLLSSGKSTMQSSSGANSPVINSHGNVTVNIGESTSKMVDHSPLINLNYMRLFGAVQVPWIMSSMYYYSGISTIDKSFSPISITYDSDKLSQFFKSWKYRTAKPLKTELWDKFSGRGFINHLICIAFNNDQNALDYLSILDYYNNNIMDEGPDAFYNDLRKSLPSLIKRTGIPDDNRKKEMWKYVESKSQEIGFLFIIIENTSNVSLSDIKIGYKEATNKTTDFNFIPINKCYGCDCVKLSSSDFLSSSETESMLQRVSGQKDKSLYMLSPGESVIWLLAVYIKDQNGFPVKYLSNIIRPTSLSFKNPKTNALEKISIREPLGEKAAQIAVPFGWYGQ